MAWTNGATKFALAALILLILMLVVAFFRFIIQPMEALAVKFGGKLVNGVGSQTVRVQVGVTPAGQPVYQDQAVQAPVYHWSLQQTWQWVACACQGIIFILYLSASGNDAWSRQSLNTGFGTVDFFFGVVKSHGSGQSFTYASLCSQTGVEKQPCGTLRAAGAFVLLLLLVQNLLSVGLWAKQLAHLFANSNTKRYEFEFRLYLLQSLLLGFTLFIWALSGHVVLKQLLSDLALGPSWSLNFTCMVLSWFMVIYSKYSIEYRRDGTPFLYHPQPVTQVVVMNQVGGPVVVQTSPVIQQNPNQQAVNGMAMMPQPQPYQGSIHSPSGYPQQHQQMSPQPYGGQPQMMQPQPQYAPALYGQQQPAQPNYGQPQMMPQQPQASMTMQMHPIVQPSYEPQYAMAAAPQYPPPAQQPPPYQDASHSQMIHPAAREQIPVTYSEVQKPGQ